MFEDSFSGIYLDDFIAYFLAEELEMKQIIGIGLEFNTLNKEMKNKIKQECYDFMLKNAMISMDFSGNTIVNYDYKEIIECFESPEYCCIVQEMDNENNQSLQRKIYKKADKYIGLDYADESSNAVYEFDNIKDAEKFSFLNLEMYSENIDEELKMFAVEDLEKEINSAKKCVIVTEYISSDDTYEAIQKIYILKDDWYEIIGDDDGQAFLYRVLYPVSLKQ